VKIRAPHVLLILVLAAMATVISGCATEPDNASVRPWNSSEGWEGVRILYPVQAGSRSSVPPEGQFSMTLKADRGPSQGKTTG